MNTSTTPSTQILFVTGSSDPIARNLSGLERKQIAVWGNKGRNEMVCELGTAFAMHARTAIQQLGVSAETVKLSDRKRYRVVILVEAAEHARRLNVLLPGWEVEHAVFIDYRHGEEPDQPDPDDAPPPGRICTLMFAARYGICADVLIRATAGRGPLRWKSIRGGGGKIGTVPALLVDIADDADERGQADANVRRREYREQALRELRNGDSTST